MNKTDKIVSGIMENAFEQRLKYFQKLRKASPKEPIPIRKIAEFFYFAGMKDRDAVQVASDNYELKELNKKVRK